VAQINTQAMANEFKEIHQAMANESRNTPAMANES
jgi:hypothetical protein